MIMLHEIRNGFMEAEIFRNVKSIIYKFLRAGVRSVFIYIYIVNLNKYHFSIHILMFELYYVYTKSKLKFEFKLIFFVIYYTCNLSTKGKISKCIVLYKTNVSSSHVNLMKMHLFIFPLVLTKTKIQIKIITLEHV